MNIPDCYYRVSVKALILDEQKRFLLAKESDGSWDFPGGGLEFGENLLEALSREVREELGLSIKSIENKPSYFVTFKKRGTEVWMANIFYECTLEDLNFKPSDECVEIRYFRSNDTISLINNGGVNEFVNNI